MIELEEFVEKLQKQTDNMHKMLEDIELDLGVDVKKDSVVVDGYSQNRIKFKLKKQSK